MAQEEIWWWHKRKYGGLLEFRVYLSPFFSLKVSFIDTGDDTDVDTGDDNDIDTGDDTGY